MKRCEIGVLSVALSVIAIHSDAAFASNDAGWNYVDDEQHLSALIRFDETGEMLETREPTDPKAKALYKTLRDTPSLDDATYSTGGVTVSAARLLNLEYETFDFVEGKRKGVTTVHGLCNTSRDSVGKLLYCLKSLKDGAAARDRKIGAYLAEHPDDKNAEAYRKVLKGQKDLQTNVGAAILAIVDRHKIPKGRLAPNGLRKDKYGNSFAPGWKKARTKKKERSGGSPLRQGPEGRFSDKFLSCVDFKGVSDDSKHLRILDPDEVCERNRGSELQPFTPEMTKFFGNVNANTFTEGYLETLRMEAIVRGMNAGYAYTGKSLDIKKCSVFQDGINRYEQSEPKPGKKSLDAKYLKDVRQGARRVQNAVDAAQKLKAYLEMPNCSDVMGADATCRDHSLSPEEREGIDTELKKINQKILEEASKYPHLMAGHTMGGDPATTLPYVEKVLTADDDHLPLVLDYAGEEISKDIKKTVEKVCEGDNAQWDELTSMPELTAAVLAKYPEYKAVQKCADLMFKAKQDYDKADALLADALGMVACTLGSFTPLVVVTGPACALAFLGKAGYNYYNADKKLEWQKACLSSGVSLCRAEDYVKAALQYDAAVSELYSQGFSAAFEGAQILKRISDMRRAVMLEQRTAAALERTTAEIKAAKSLDEAEKIAADFRAGQGRLKATAGSRAAELEAELTSVTKNLTAEKKAAIDAAHKIGEGGKGVFTKAELKQKVKILKDAGFTEKEREALLRSGICGDSTRMPAAYVGAARPPAALQGSEPGKLTSFENSARKSGKAVEFSEISDVELDKVFQQAQTVQTSKPLDPAKLLGTGASSAGAKGGVFAHHVDGVDHEVAIKVWGDRTIANIGEEEMKKRMARELIQGREMARLGVGPQYHGIVDLGEGRYGLVMDKAEGTFWEEAKGLITDRTVNQTEQLLQRLEANGYRVRGDVQFMIKADGAPIMIDAENLIAASECAKIGGCANIDDVLSSLEGYGGLKGTPGGSMAGSLPPPPAGP